jgi:tetratricopeptide (TPR) repeat protein
MSAPRPRDATVVAAIVRRIGMSDPVALTNAAWFAARRGHPDIALRCAEQAATLPGASRATRRTLEQLRAGTPDQLLLALPASLSAAAPSADATVVDVHARSDAMIEATLAEGRALLASGRLADSLGRFDAVLHVRPSDPVALFHRGVALAKLRRYGDALHDWHAVERTDPAGPLGAVSRRHADSARRLADLFTGT